MDGLCGIAPSDDFSRLSSFFVPGVEGGSNSTETVAGGGGGGPAGLVCCGSEWSCFFLRGGFTGGELSLLVLGGGASWAVPPLCGALVSVPLLLLLLRQFWNRTL